MSNSKTTFVTVNLKTLLVGKVRTNHSKTTFVTVNQHYKGKTPEYIVNSKTTFVTVNPGPSPLVNGTESIQKQRLLLLIAKKI